MEMLLTRRVFNRTKEYFYGTTIAVGLSAVVLSGCSMTEELTHGYVLEEQTLELVPPGSSKEQVLLSLGTPTVEGDYGGEAYYYISQKKVKRAEFLKPRLVDQSILAVYFNEEDETVTRLANYTLEDGKVFDTISRTTPTGGLEETFLTRVLSSVSGGGKAAATSGLFGGNQQ